VKNNWFLFLFLSVLVVLGITYGSTRLARLNKRADKVAADIKVEPTRDGYNIHFRGPKSTRASNKEYNPLGSKGINPDHSRPAVEPKGKL
jgi:hypothetical protein